MSDGMEIPYRKNIQIAGVITKNFYQNFLQTGLTPQTISQLSVCSLLEFRADTFFPEEYASSIGQIRKVLQDNGIHGVKMLFTIRLGRDGGEWSQPPEQRYSLFEAASLQNLAEYIDLEVEEYPGMPDPLIQDIRSSGIKLIVSHHHFEKSYSPAGFEALLQEMERCRPDLAKFAVTVQNEAELEDLFRFAAVLGKRLPGSCLMSMGRFGASTRVGSPLLGCSLSYGFLGGVPVVPGQLGVEDLYLRYSGLCTREFSDLPVKKFLETVRFPWN